MPLDERKDRKVEIRSNYFKVRVSDWKATVSIYDVLLADRAAIRNMIRIATSLIDRSGAVFMERSCRKTKNENCVKITFKGDYDADEIIKTIEEQVWS